VIGQSFHKMGTLPQGRNIMLYPTSERSERKV